MKNIIETIRKERKWLVRQIGQNIELIRMLGNKPIVVTLKKKEGEKKFQLAFPSYVFRSTISHWAPSADEIRFCRNKVLLKSLVKALKRSPAWKLIDNQYFLVINNDNPRSNKKFVRNQLKELYNYEPKTK